jgi:hypothetical protein
MKEQKKSRRSFILRSIGITAAAAITGWFASGRKKNETVKMLTQDGRLVEIDKNFLESPGKKIKEEEIHTWVKNKSTTTKIN